MIIQCINEGTAKEITSCCSDPSAARSVLRYIVRLENSSLPNRVKAFEYAHQLGDVDLGDVANQINDFGSYSQLN